MSFGRYCLRRTFRPANRYRYPRPVVSLRHRCPRPSPARPLSFTCPCSQRWIRSISSSRCLSSSFSSGDTYERYRQSSEDVIKLIQQENDRTRNCIDQSLKEEISREILEAYDAYSAEDSVPELGPTGRYLHYAKDSRGERRYYRRHVDSGEKQLVLDMNFLEYQLHAMSLSVNEAFVAFLVSPVASPTNTVVKIRRVESSSGTEFVLSADDLKVTNVEWGPLQEDGSDSLFVTTCDEKGRPDAVYACSVDTDGKASTLRCLYHNDDEAVMVDVQRTKGCEYVAIYASTKSSSEIRLMKSINDSPILVRPREEGVLYHVDVGANDVVFVLAHAAEPQHEIGLLEEMSLFQTKVPSLPLQSMSELDCYQNDDEFRIADMDVFNGFVALYERSSVDGRYRIRLKRRSESTLVDDTIIPFPNNCGDCAVLSSSGNMFYRSTRIHFHIESPCNPGSTFSFDTSTGDLKMLSGEATPSRYVEKRVPVISKDGTRVPLTLLYLNGDEMKKIHIEGAGIPAVLIGYGAYGEPVCHGFDPTIIPLLNRGFVIAYAHTRGGGELGREWYRAGRLHGKEKAIEDYIACAEALVGPLEITEPRLLTGKAFSAGGVIVAGAMNRQASLFGNVVLTNAFLDVTTAMTNPDLFLTQHEWDEWGNVAKDPMVANMISSYCPMANVAPLDYPKMLLVGTIDDENVPFWHPLTFALKVRAALEARETQKRDAHTLNRVLVHIEQSGGHQMHGTKLDVSAMETAFIIQCSSRTDL